MTDRCAESESVTFHSYYYLILTPLIGFSCRCVFLYCSTANLIEYQISK